MRILDLNELKNYKENSCVTIGFFDGLHLGHKKIIDSLINNAKNNNLKSVVITFSDDVLSYFKVSNAIFPLKNKIEFFEELNIDYLLILSIKDDFINLDANSFLNKILKPLNCQKIICGNDFSFAKNKEGNINFIKNNTNIDIEIVDDVYFNNNKVSSSYIRNLLKDGKIDIANKLLLKPFFVESKVIQGKQIGRTINFKTANLEINDSCYLLKNGVYFGKIIVLNKEYDALINVGSNPTINDEKSLKIEANILNFNEDIYDDKIIAIFTYFKREEVKFNSLNDLKKQIEKDYNDLLKYLNM